MEGVRHPEQSEGKVPEAERLRKELKAAREDLGLRTTEFETAQARLTELEQKLRLIHQSRTYRLAVRVWRIRSRARVLFSRRRPKASRELPQTAASRTTEVTKQGLSDSGGSGTESARDAAPPVYYGSRGVRSSDQQPSGPLQAVLLLGGLTEPEVADALRSLTLDGRVNGDPLVITDCDALRTLDNAGYLYEYLPPREDWEERLGREGDDYDEFVRRRLSLIAATYGLAEVPSTS